MIFAFHLKMQSKPGDFKEDSSNPNRRPTHLASQSIVTVLGRVDLHRFQPRPHVSSAETSCPSRS